MARPPIWKRTYLLEPRLQLGITFYFLLFEIATLSMIYFSVKASLMAVLQHTASMSPSCSVLIKDNEENIRQILMVIFGTNAVVMTMFALIGGILISHRIVGPLFRVKTVLRQILDGKDPGHIRVRHSDYFTEIVPLLEELQKQKSPKTETEKV